MLLSLVTTSCLAFAAPPLSSRSALVSRQTALVALAAEPSLFELVEARDFGSVVQRARRDPSSLLDLVKEAGVAGAVSYTVVELSFFAIALPVGYFVWHANTGEGLQPLLLLQAGSGTDKVRLLGLVASYIVLLKTLFPLRLGSTLLLTPATRRLLEQLPSLPTLPAGGTSSARRSLKRELLEMAAVSRGGIDVFAPEEQSRFDELVDELCALCPTSSPVASTLFSGEWAGRGSCICDHVAWSRLALSLALSATLSLALTPSSPSPLSSAPPLPSPTPPGSGEWECRWTTERELKFVISSGLLGEPWERTYQTIDMAAGKVETTIQCARGSYLKVGSTISADATDEAGRRFDFAFDRCALCWRGFELPLPPVGCGRGELMYLDETMRIQRNVRGDLLIAVRDA